MIFVSSSCIKKDRIKDSILVLVNEGFKNIELSGGTNFYEGYLEDLQEIQDKYSLNYQLHNYFPPPKEHFMLNLSSLDEDLYHKSIEHCMTAISMCKKLRSRKYAIHAGFLIDFLPSEAGKKISLKRVNDKKNAYRRFSSAWKLLEDFADGEVDLYIENNVFSKSNKETYKDNNPFLFTDYISWTEFSNEVKCNLLLDFAHLKVSATSLNLSFSSEVDHLFGLTDYFHISGNDGFHDQNQSIVIDKDMITILDKYDWFNKTITLEVYDGISSLHQSFDLLNNKIN